MKISIELKDKKCTVTYGGISGIGTNVQEAIANLVEKFRGEIQKIFANH